MSLATRLAWRAKRLRCDDQLAGWLRDRGSLTARLQAHGDFAVRLLRQELARPTRDEAAALGVKQDRLLWVREVALHVDGRALVFAHTVLPCRPRGPLAPAFKRLGARSLGALLFAHPGFKRGPLHCRRLDARHPLFTPAIAALKLGQNPPAALWEWCCSASSALTGSATRPITLS